MDVFAALADPVRRSLLEDISAGPQRVVDLAAGRPISRPAVSKHLRVLSGAGLVEASEHGRERHYALRPQALAPVKAYVAGLVGGTPSSPGFAQALDALDTEVRRTTRERRTPASRLSRDTHEETA